jgi:hypothetical protein
MAELGAFVRCGPGAVAGHRVPRALEAWVALDAHLQEVAGARPLVAPERFARRAGNARAAATLGDRVTVECATSVSRPRSTVVPSRCAHAPRRPTPQPPALSASASTAADSSDLVPTRPSRDPRCWRPTNAASTDEPSPRAPTSSLCPSDHGRTRSHARTRASATAAPSGPTSPDLDRARDRQVRARQPAGKRPAPLRKTPAWVTRTTRAAPSRRHTCAFAPRRRSPAVIRPLAERLATRRLP